MTARLFQTLLLLTVWPFCVAWSAVRASCAVSLTIARHILSVWEHKE